MRTLKKTLALVLVLAMALSLCVIGANASFTDVDEDTEYTEAIQVLTGIGVINGMTATTFVPDGTLTREQAAKIVCYILLGADYADLISSATSQTFADVAADRWSAGYIEYCANLGIIAGVGDNNFDPTGTLTTAAFTKMLLCAVGFDAEEEGYVGSSWAINVASDAVEADLYDSDIAISASIEITRAEACQLAYLALFYAPEGTTTQYVVVDTDNDNAVVGTFDAFIEAYLLAGTDEYYEIQTKDIAEGSLADDVFGLTKGTGTDSFGRPATVYTCDDFDDDLTFADDATFTFTADVSESTMKTTLKNYTYSTKLADDMNSYVEIAAATGNGITVEVYAGSDKEIDAVVVIEPKFEDIAVSTKDESKLVGGYTKYVIDAGSFYVYSSVVDEEADVTTASVTGTVEDGDMVLTYTNAAGTYAYIAAVDTFSGVLTSISSSGTYTISGSAYKLAACGTAPSISSSTQTFYVDSFGYILGTATASTAINYAMVIDTDYYDTLSGTKIVETYSATLAFPDGTVAEVETVDDTDEDGEPVEYTSVGDVVTYKVGENGYVLTDATEADAVEQLASGFAKDNSVLVEGTLYANSATKFVFANYDEDGVDGTVTVYTGIANVPTISDTDLVIYGVDTDDDADTIANVVFVYSDVISTTTDSYVYYTGSYVETSAGYVLDVVVSGELTTLTVTSTTGLADDTLYESIKDDGSATTYTEAIDGNDKVQNVGGLLFVDGKYDESTITSSTPVYVIDQYDDEVIVKTFAGITTAQESTENVYIVKSGDTVVAIYVIVDSTID